MGDVKSVPSLLAITVLCLWVIMLFAFKMGAYHHSYWWDTATTSTAVAVRLL